jgi:oligopeptide transport system substrate-binding protein
MPAALRAPAVALALLAVFAAAGCERTGPDPAQGEVLLRRGNAGEPDSLDPQRSEEAFSRQIIRDLYDGLVDEGADGELVPRAARDWTVSADGLVWTFRLREDARWSNGDPVTAEDFVAGLRRAVDPAIASTSGGLLAPLAGAGPIIRGEAPPESLGVRALGEHELELRLDAPTPYLPGLLSSTFTYPVHRPSLAAWDGDFARAGRLVSNGPYRLAEWTLHARIRLERNPHYAEPPPIGTVVYYPTEDAVAELNRYRAGELDLTAQIPHTRFRWVKEHLADELHVAPYLSTQFWMFNLRSPPLDDVRVRRALTMAVDRERLTELVTGLGEAPAYGLVPPGVANYRPQSFSWRDMPAEERVAEALVLLATAGYGPERPLAIEVRYNTDENLRRVATAVASMWRESLGVEATLLNEELRVMLARRKQPTQWQVMRLSWVGDYNDASNFLEILATDGAVSDTGFADPEFERLLDEAAGEIDPGRRAALLEAAERIVLSQYPVLPLYFTVSKHLVKPWVRGFKGNVLNHVDTRYLSVDTDARGF